MSSARQASTLQEIGRYRDLLLMLTWRDIKIKYKQSIMGLLWAILMPMLIVSAGLLVRYAFSRLTGEPVSLQDLAAVAVKSVPWAFVVSGIRFATTSLISNVSLVTKIYFPRELFPIAATLSQLFDFAIATAVLAVILIIARIGGSLQLLWMPMLLVILFVLVLSFGVLFSSLALFFRDVKYLVEVVLTFGIFFTPVFYEVEIFGRWAPLLMLNPFSPIMEGLDATIVRHEPPSLVWLGYSAVWALLALVVSFRVFKSLEPSFAENI